MVEATDVEEEPLRVEPAVFVEEEPLSIEPAVIEEVIAIADQCCEGCSRSRDKPYLIVGPQPLLDSESSEPETPDGEAEPAPPMTPPTAEDAEHDLEHFSAFANHVRARLIDVEMLYTLRSSRPVLSYEYLSVHNLLVAVLPQFKAYVNDVFQSFINDLY